MAAPPPCVQEVLTVDGRVWSMSEMVCPLPPMPSYPLYVVSQAVTDPPAVVTQHNQMDRKFVIINSQVLLLSL